jgi:hypothetical protein
MLISLFSIAVRFNVGSKLLRREGALLAPANLHGDFQGFTGLCGPARGKGLSCIRKTITLLN